MAGGTPANGDFFENKIFGQEHPDGCFVGCTLSCTKGCEQYTLKTGPLAGNTVAVDGPEYETAAAITNLDIFDIDCMLEYAWYSFKNYFVTFAHASSTNR